MMMIGGRERERETHHPTVQVPPWEDYLDDPTVNMLSPYSVSPSGGNGVSPFDSLTALHRYLPSNVNNSFCDEEYDEPVDAFACDHFRMYEFKVRRCARGRSHDWTECPYAHPGEKARRRDPRKFIYSGNSCPEFRKGQCLKGDLCEYAHGVFECWLHPSRYRTQPCKDGTHCRRRVCFFAHTPDQLRIPSPRLDPGPESYDGSPGRVLYSPPDSPSGSNSVNQLVSSINNLQIEKKSLQMGMGVGMGMSMSPPSWGGFCSPRSPSTLRPAFLSLPTTPTRGPIRSGLGVFDIWDKPTEEEPVMERVESGRDLRARIYAKLSRENSVGRGDPGNSGPDVGWISELVK